VILSNSPLDGNSREAMHACLGVFLLYIITKAKIAFSMAKSLGFVYGGMEMFFIGLLVIIRINKVK
jgi:hypothetical protein